MQSKQLPITSAKDQDSGSEVGSAVAPASAGGFWRSISELEQTPEFEQFVQREFPQAASEFPDGVSRRRWLKLMSASFALGGLAGCRYGRNEFAAFVTRPENTIPGIPKHYATNFELAGRAVHLLISNLDGRPIKVEGNPEHPAIRASEPNDLANGKSRFASSGTDVFSQACVLGLYDPDRTSRVSRRYEDELVETTWQVFVEYAATELENLKSSQGGKLAVLMSPSLSPSLNRMVARVAELLPQVTVAQYSSLDDSGASRAFEQVAGQPAELLLDLSQAQVICCLDSDLLGNHPNMVVHSRQFAKGRAPEVGSMNRLYAVESQYTVTGAAADSRLPLRSSQVGAFVARLEKRVDELLGGGQAASASSDDEPFDKISAEEQLGRMVDAMAEDLVAHQGHGLVSVGAHQPYEAQMAALRLNKKLGNFGATASLMPSRSQVEGVETVGLGDLVAKLQSGEVDHVWVLGDNPVYTSPAELKLADLLSKLEHVVYVAEFEDETAMSSTWVLPAAHPLESWGDVAGADGSYGICQPQILPLLGGKTTCEILSILIGEPQLGEEIVRKTAQGVAGGELSARLWREALHDGYLRGSSVSALPVGDVEAPAPIGDLTVGEYEGGDVEVLFAASDTLYDGRFAKNVWLQELPQPMTKLVWDNAAIVSPQTAAKLGLSQGARTTTETVVLIKDGRRIELPVFIMPGQAPGAVTVHLGYGRICRDEAVVSDEQVKVGVDPSPLRSPDNSQILTGVQAQRTSRPYKLVTTQDHFAIDKLGLEVTKERAAILVREGTLEQIEEGGEEFVEHLGTHHPELESLWEEPIATLEDDPTVQHQWGMTVDLNKCTGCNSCVVACQAENNIPVVGKEQVSRGREMHWIRLDRYFRGDVETPKIVNQPVACVHCETAPCEQVCPVAATVHTEEGINAMAYNRCVGTRYCANNCPYKVRRFNYFNYNTEYGYFYGWQQRGKLEEASRKLQQLVLNPEVTVRGRGVMEKCTYCIQRVQNGKIYARAEGRAVEDGEIQTACQMACPTQAIVFGDLKDKKSKVSQLQADPRAYAMLAELNIKPRTLYLARVRNTHPRLKTEDQLVEAHHGAGHGAHGEEGHGEDHAGHEEDHA
ncbi:MAG: TAT-variant-translocated molybdopterin oxidoreductase [bacterium]|nr:TAT-variant-translocated molybdopterin oxidoreductase [bacterium]